VTEWVYCRSGYGYVGPTEDPMRCPRCAGWDVTRTIPHVEKPKVEKPKVEKPKDEPIDPTTVMGIIRQP
jgi:hypothetical protein